jgi:fumarate reductase subunit C
MTTAPRADRPGLYYPKLPITWWLRRPSYFRFMLREISSVFIAIVLVIFLVQLYQLGQGPNVYAAFVQQLRSPGWVIFHLVALAFVIYHSVTWLSLAAVIQVVRIGERQVPPKLVAAGAFVAWAVISLVVVILFFLLLGG